MCACVRVFEFVPVDVFGCFYLPTNTFDLKSRAQSRYHFDVPTAPHFMKGDLAGAKGSRSEATGRQEFASEVRSIHITALRTAGWFGDGKLL